MYGKGQIWPFSILISILLIATFSCGGSSTPSIGERATNTAVGSGPGDGFLLQGDDPLPEILLPSAGEIEEPQQDPNPPDPLLGEFVVFYTRQSDCSFVTKEEFEAFTGIEPPWNPNILLLSEFRAQYGSSILLTPKTPYPGLVIYDPYHLSVQELNIDDNLQFLIEPGMSEEEAFQAILSYVRNIAEGKTTASVKEASRIFTPNPPTHDIHMDVVDWVVSRFDPAPWWLYFTGTSYNHAALVFWPGCAHTDSTTPRYYSLHHPDWRFGGGVNLWDATVMEAIGPRYLHSYQVGHYWYSRGFIDPGSRLAEISYNYSQYVWADPNWASIIIGVLNYAYDQDTRGYGFPVHKYDFGRPLIPYTKDTYCSHLIWQSYCWSTVFNASDPRILAMDIDWNGGYIVYPEDLINTKYTREYEYWLR